MGFPEQIANEVQNLPVQLQAEVLSFVGALKAKDAKSRESLPTLSTEQTQKRDALLQALSAFSADMTGFAFDREDANVRR